MMTWQMHSHLSPIKYDILSRKWKKYLFSVCRLFCLVWCLKCTLKIFQIELITGWHDIDEWMETCWFLLRIWLAINNIIGEKRQQCSNQLNQFHSPLSFCGQRSASMYQFMSIHKFYVPIFDLVHEIQ